MGKIGPGLLVPWLGLERDPVACRLGTQELDGDGGLMGTTLVDFDLDKHEADMRDFELEFSLDPSK